MPRHGLTRPAAEPGAVRAGDGTLLPVETHGSGEPVTVFAHGLGASVAETRLLGVAVRGSKVFYVARGHPGARSPAGARYGWPELIGDLAAVADHAAARRAVGVSLGAGALLGLLAARPGRFERVVLFLPAVADRPRTDPTGRLGTLARLVEDGDRPALAAELARDLPDLPGARDYVRQRAAALAGSGVGAVIRDVAGRAPVARADPLHQVACPVLLVAQEGDEVHPAEVARRLADLFPAARLEVFAENAALWRARSRLRTVVSSFLNS